MKAAWALAILIPSIFFLSQGIDRRLKYPYPPFNELVLDLGEDFKGMHPADRPLASSGGFRDLSGLGFGMRRLTADIAWLSVLQYYGTHAEADEHQSLEGGNMGAGHYPLLKKMILRVVRLDPNFHFAFLYGAGSLAFNLEKYDEATELLEEAVRRNPTYWKYRTYIAAIVWKKKGEFDNLIPLLEDAITYPDCPILVKSSLANIYKKRGNIKRALEIWLDVLESDNLDTTYRAQAEGQIEELRGRLGI
jgi:tetratricopeptide (TPR) repeat protein